MSWSDGCGWLGWLRRNDPLGSTIKDGIVAAFGALLIVKGLPWLGLVFLVLGLAALAMPIWFYRRDQERLRRWQSRRTP